MTITNLYLLNNVVNGVPSGNYDGSSLDFDSDGVKAVGYYPSFGNLQTINIRVTNFQGIIKIQATLDDQWQTANWFDTETYDAGEVSPVTDYRSIPLIGNFSWVRAQVFDFVAGTIDFVTITY